MDVKENLETPRELDFELDNSLLTTVCDEFDFANPVIEPILLSNSLTVAREKFGGVGLAANQVGINTRVVVIKGFDSGLFNPRIVSSGGENALMEEGCLSFPGLIVKVKRPTIIRVRYANALGQVQTNSYHGMTARQILHEIDHINGILFFHRANKFHRDQAFRRWKKPTTVVQPQVESDFKRWWS